MKNHFNKISRKQVGTILIWMGVFAWVRYIYLITNDVKTSIFPYLFVYLVGRIGGGKLRGRSSDAKLTVGKWRRRISTILIYLGVMAWLPYIYLKNEVGADVDITPYLIIHLTGILSGIFVRLSESITQMQQKEKAEAVIIQAK